MMNNGCCNRNQREWSFTPGCAICFLLLVLTFAIGLVVGVVNAETYFPALAAIIAFAAAIAAIAVALILFNCRKKRAC